MRFNADIKRIVVVLLITSLALLGFSEATDNLREKDYSFNQTVPTRTPTPSVIDPTNTRPPSTPKPGDPTPTSTGPAQTVVSASPTIELVETPLGGYLPTAAACTEPPVVQALDTVNVRAMPDSDSDLIDQLVYLEVRQIIGRSKYDAWWMIELQAGNSGWVIDEGVSVSGYIGNVPVADPAPMNDQTPTPSSTWSPTVQPQCTPLPTHTFTPPPTATRAGEVTKSSVQPTTDNSVTASTDTSGTPTDTPTKQNGTNTPSPLESTVSADELPTVSSGETDNGDEELEGDGADGSGFSANIVLYVGAGLILLGIGIYVVRRLISS